jgi:DNA transformation protein
MAADPAYRDYILEQMADIDDVSSKSMFGGFGIYHGGKMFALITSDDLLHLKVDDHNRARFEAQGCTQFHNMLYYSAPAEVIEDPEALAEWAQPSIEAALRK